METQQGAKRIVGENISYCSRKLKKRKMILMRGKVTLALIIIMICLCIFSIATTKTFIINKSKEMLKSISITESQEINLLIHNYSLMINQIATNDFIVNNNVTLNEKNSKLDLISDRLGLKRINIADVEGNYTDKYGELGNVLDMKYFSQAMSGKTFISEPYLDTSNEMLEIAISTPIDVNGKIVGVLIAYIDANKLFSVILNTTTAKVYDIYLINESGDIIVHNNFEFEGIKIWDKVKDKKFTDKIKSTYQKTTLGNKSSFEYVYNDKKKYIQFMPIEMTGWTMAVEVNSKKLLRYSTINID